MTEPQTGALRYSSARGRWALAAVILGSGAAFLESSVVTVALPAIGRDLDLELGGLQWVMNAYLLSLSALMITGGSLGDLYGRRTIFIVGLIGFAGTSLLCAVAPSGEVLIAARVLQGAAAALLVPASLAIVEASFAEEDRGGAIGAWSGWSGISSLIGPFLGGWLVDTASWRWVFAIVVVVALVARLARRSPPAGEPSAAVRGHAARLDRLRARQPRARRAHLFAGRGGRGRARRPRRGRGRRRRLRAAGRIPALRAPCVRADAAAGNLSLAPVLGRQRGDARQLPRDRRDVLLPLAPAPGRARLQRARRRRGLVSRDADHAALLPAGGQARAADRPANPDDASGQSCSPSAWSCSPGSSSGDDYLAVGFCPG